MSVYWFITLRLRIFVGKKAVLVHNYKNTSNNSRELRNNMQREGRVVGEGQAASHIVASCGEKRQWQFAKESRRILGKYGIGVNNAANGVPLGNPIPHNYTHTTDFNQRVFYRLQSLESNMINMGYGKNAIKGALQKELRNIGKQVLNGNFLI